MSFSLNITEYIFICVMWNIDATKGCLIYVIFISFKINFVSTMSGLEMGHINYVIELLLDIITMCKYHVGNGSLHFMRWKE
mgnify:CR=1 FL=1